MRELSAKQQKFADEYLVDFDLQAAAARSNYRSNTKTLQLPNVKSYIIEKQKAMSKKLEVDSHWVLDSLLLVYRRCMQAKNVYDSNGVSVKGAFNPVSALKALELIGKHIDVDAFSRQKIEITGKGGSPLIMWGNSNNSLAEPPMRTLSPLSYADSLIASPWLENATQVPDMSPLSNDDAQVSGVSFSFPRIPGNEGKVLRSDDVISAKI